MNSDRSVTCHCCGGLADERETTHLTDESGDICPECSEAIDVEIDKAWNNLKGYTSEISDRDIITELACRLVEAYKELDDANKTIRRLYGR